MTSTDLRPTIAHAQRTITEFLLSDIETGLQLLQHAVSTREPQLAERDIALASEAYESVGQKLRRTPLDPEQWNEVVEALEKLGAQLRAAGRDPESML